MSRRADYEKSYAELFAAAPPADTKWESSQADILQPARGFIGAFDYTMQLQVGCPGGCLFCYVPTSTRLTPASVRGKQGRTWGYIIRNKENVIPKFEKYLYEEKLSDKTIYWSGVTDPYAAAPGITRQLWETLLHAPLTQRPRRLVVQSRFRPDRDVELMQAYHQTTPTSDGGPAVVISYSIGTDRNDLIGAWEKSTPFFEQRTAAIQTLTAADLCVIATLSPLGPWHDLPSTLLRFKDWGVSYLTTLFIKENSDSSNTPPLFLAYIRKHYPELLDSHWQEAQVKVMRMVFGHNGVLVGQNGFTSLAKPHEVVRLLQE